MLGVAEHAGAVGLTPFRNAGQLGDGGRQTDLAHALFEPVREMVERGGKAWRSYAALGCIDVLGGDMRKYLH